jgi:hypothetical protein
MATEWKHKFVVFRIDRYAFEEARASFKPSQAVTIKEIVDTEDEAQAEVKRLMELNSDKGCEYHWQSAKYYPEGR